MNVKIKESGGVKIAVCESADVVIKDGQSTLDFIADIGYHYDCRCIAINKAAIAEDFFKLSSGVAGEVTQKIVNYNYRFAIIGDFSAYTSKPLHDFISESNKGGDIFFVGDEYEAAEKFRINN
jgi:hypothetical protein